MRLLQHIFLISIIVFYSDINYAISATPSVFNPPVLPSSSKKPSSSKPSKTTLSSSTPSSDKLIIEIVNTLLETTPVEKKTTKELYKLSEQKPVWTSDKNIKAAFKLLGNAHRKGLKNKDYKVEWLKTKWKFLKNAKFPSFHQVALFDSTLSNSVLHYYSDTRYGRIKTRRVGAFLEQNKKVPEFTQKIWDAIQNEQLVELEEEFEPTLFLYENLKRALNNYQDAYEQDPKGFKSGKTLKKGGKGEQVARLRRLLITMEDFPVDKDGQPKNTTAAENVFDKSLVEALKNYQGRHWLKKTGYVDNRTLKTLNHPLPKRIEKIELGLERLRWQPHYTENRLILVNIPSFRLWAYNNLDEKPFTIRVVVGKTKGHKTPTLSSKMGHVVFRPYWGIPSSILKKEIYPAMKRDPSYLKRKGMEMTRGGRVRQKPGGRNALGLVKFIFPNRHAIYLHDTPSKSLFRRSRRDFSHGCVRVSQPGDLAAYLLGWKKANVKKAMHKGKNNRWVKVKGKIPVMIMYSTALARTGPGVTFIGDVYGKDATLKRLLNQRHHSI
ncbi:MAG: L,D-transpeptidase family protein [Methylococcales bacterium]|nr:L,D-transpeptidase family protein [Methylococcales bacterium]